jgi:hypothetical protein
MSSVRPEAVTWLWEHRIPRGKLTLLDGDPGVGKSSVALAIATAITRGAPLPADLRPRRPGRVILLTGEDGLADTVRPRLDGMGADASRVEVLAAMREEADDERPLNLATDQWAVEEMVQGGLYDLVIIDPLNAYLPSDLDTHRDSSVRSVLAPLARLAEQHSVAILCVRHLTKGSRDRAIYRGQGSIAYTAAARVVHLVGLDRNDPTGRRRVILPIKSNVGPLLPAVGFELVDGRFGWLGECDVQAEALLAPDPSPGERDETDEAVSALREILNNGPLSADDAKHQAHTAGLSEAAIRRARTVLGVKPRKDGYQGRWIWALPKVTG